VPPVTKTKQQQQKKNVKDRKYFSNSSVRTQMSLSV